LETKDAGEEAMERNNWASQNSQRVVELKEEKEEEEEEDVLISQIYFWNKIVHISYSSSVHHQEFFTVHTTIQTGFARLPLDGFSWNLIFENFFSKTYRESSNFTKIGQEYRALYMKTNIHFRSYLALSYSEWKIFQINL
jgi:hypothetical protein